MWKNSSQIAEDLLSKGRKDQLPCALALFAAHKILNGAILKNEFSATPYADSLVLSKYGEDTVRSIADVTTDQSAADLKLAALALFYHQEPLLDFTACDSEAIHAALTEDLLRGSVLLPSRFGRELYDKFNDDFVQLAKERASYLDHADAVRLLEGTPQGNYQIGNFAMGPLGVLRVEQKRFIPPARKVPLWHCADTGCNALHSVELRSFGHKFLQLASTVRAALLDNIGPPSEWLYPFHRLSAEPGSPHEGRKYFDVPVLAGDSLDVNEIRQLLIDALSSADRGVIIDVLSQSRSTDNWKGMGPDVVAQKLGHNEILQLLMMLPNTRMVELIDRATAGKQVNIPVSEARASKSFAPKISLTDPRSTLSALGVRPDRDQPVAYMAAAIWKAYAEAGSLTDLEWRCRKGAGSATPSSPIDFMRSHDPADIIKELVLPSRDITLFLANHLNLQLPAFDDEETVVSRFLWKLGFDLPRFDDRYARFHRQSAAFRDELLGATGRLTDDDRDRLRSKGVNVFVALEAILEDLIAYNAWLFFSDHFAGALFSYRRSDAMQCVRSVLGEKLITGANEASWSLTGHNTLGPLLVYLRALVKELNARILADREPLLRKAEELPHFDDKDRFAFRHVQLWADTSAIEMKSYVDELNAVAARLEKASPAEVRNGLDHFREENRFPKVENMTNCELFVSDAVRVAEERRLLPMPLWLKRRTTDNVGRIEYELEDHAGRRSILYGPSAILGLRHVTFGQPFLVPSTNLIGHTNSDLVFEITEESPYSNYWANYPRRQSIISPQASPSEDKAGEVVETAELTEDAK
jgi:hypothetical protein